MNQNGISRTKLLLNRLFANDYTPTSPEQYFSAEEWSELTIHHFPKGKTIIKWGFPATTIWFMLRGRAKVLVSSTEGQQAVVDSIEAPHIFGVIEAVRELSIYSASVVADRECILVGVPKDEFFNAVYHDTEDAQVLIKYLVWLASASMDKTELKAIVKPKELLLRYLYRYSRDQQLPYRMPTTKKAISEELHINLRTLYRYLDELQLQGYFETQRGRIVITEQNYRNLKEVNRHTEDNKDIIAMIWT